MVCGFLQSLFDNHSLHMVNTGLKVNGEEFWATLVEILEFLISTRYMLISFGFLY